jgi:uncharacterized protein involved in tolerance to divalent cations
MEMRVRARAPDAAWCYQRLCALMHVSNSSAACINLMEDASANYAWILGGIAQNKTRVGQVSEITLGTPVSLET